MNLEEEIDLKWLTGDLSYKLHTGQLEILKVLEDSAKRETLIFCARQWGKSYLLLTYCLMYALRHPGSRILYGSESIKQAGEIVKSNMPQIVADAPKGLIRQNKSDLTWYIGAKEKPSVLKLGSLARSEIDSLRGSKCHVFVGEEGGFVKSSDYRYAVRSVIAPQLLRTKGKMVHVTTPSKDPEHYIHTHVIPECVSEHSMFRYTIFDNPQITREDVRQMCKLLGGQNSEEWQREALCQIVRDQATVPLPNYVPHSDDPTKLIPSDFFVHLDPFSHCEWGVFGDWGGTVDHTCFLFVQYDSVTDMDIYFDELYFTQNTGMVEIVSRLREKIKFWENRIVKRKQGIYCDAHGDTRVNFLAEMKENLLSVRKEDFDAALKSLRARYDRGKIRISTRCKMLDETCRGAQFNANRDGWARTKRLGHMDALQAQVYANKMLDRTVGASALRLGDRFGKLARIFG